MSAAVEIVPAVSGGEMERFVRLPLRLNAADPAWTPPLLMERREALSPKHNPLFEHAEAAFWLARSRIHGKSSMTASTFQAPLRAR